MLNSKNYSIALLPGDGIGPEVIASAQAVLEALGRLEHINFTFFEALIGGAAYQATGTTLPPLTLATCRRCDAVLAGPVGGPPWDHLSTYKKPERALIDLRKHLGCYANLRPVKSLSPDRMMSPLSKSVLSQGLDILIVRDVSAGMYAGEKGRTGAVGTLQEKAFDVETYEANEIMRIAHLAFQQARRRKKHLVSIDNANILETSRLWREIVERTSKEYPDVQVESLYTTIAFRRLLHEPSTFDVILVNNVFGDVTSDILAAMSFSYATLPSASLSLGNGPSIFEAVHGTALSIQGKNICNPLGTVLSCALLLRYGLKEETAAYRVERAVENVLQNAYRTADMIHEKVYADQERLQSYTILGTKEMTQAIIQAL